MAEKLFTPFQVDDSCPACAGLDGGHRYGYARVSTPGQDITPQIEQLHAWGCCRVFQDVGISGTRASRPDYDELFRVLGKGDQVMATKLDRFGRSMRYLAGDLGRAGDIGAHLVVPGTGIDTRQRMGKIIFQFLALVAEIENILLHERLDDRREHVHNIGNMRRAIGGPIPFGFRDPGGNDERDWVIDPLAAAYLADAADRLLNPRTDRHGVSLGNIPAIVTELAALPRYADIKMTVTRLRWALKSPSSGGWIVWDEDPDNRVAAATGGPLDEETWYRLHRHFDRNRAGRPAVEGRFPLGPLLRCGKCGNQLSGEMRKNYQRRGPDGEKVPATYTAYYACRNPHPAQRREDGTLMDYACRGVSVRRDDVDQLFAAAYAEWAASDAGRAAASQPAATAGPRAELEEQRAERMEWLADNDRLRRRGRRTREEHAAAQADIEADMDRIEAELAALALIDATPATLEPWEQLTPHEKRTMAARAVVCPVVVRDGGRGVHGHPVPANERMTLVPAPQ